MTATAPDRSRTRADHPGWVACGGCGEIVYGKQFAAALRVCRGCGWHARLTARERIEQLFDPGSAQPLPHGSTVEDPLGFVDRRPYLERLREARDRTAMDEAVECVQGTIGGHPLVAAVMDFGFLGGSLGSAVGERIAGAADHALHRRIPLLLVTASGGARMQEGVIALMQMAKTSQALVRLERAGVPTVTLATDPTYGGVAASFATMTDVILAEPAARIGFAGPRVIEQTVRQRLPEGFQSAEFLRERGLLDAVVPRAALRSTLARLLAALRPAGEDAAGPRPDPGLIRRPERLPRRSPWEAVRLARQSGRPTALDYFRQLAEDFTELHGDRLTADCPALVGGVGRINGAPAVLVGHQKGRDTRDSVARNFGMPSPAGYRKAARLIRLAAKLRCPLVTLVDTPGADPGVSAEEQGQAWAIAENLRLLSDVPVPVVAVVTGEGGSGGALALAVADRVLALEHAIYSVISPEGCAAILWKSQDAAAQAAAALRLDAAQLLGMGVLDAVIPEPPGGAQQDRTEAVSRLRGAVEHVLAELSGRDPARLLSARHRRFSAYGTGRREW